MKVYAISADKDYYRIGDRSDTKDWYTKTESTAGILRTVNTGDEVKLTFEKDKTGKRLLTSLEITKKGEFNKNSRDNRFRTPEEMKRDETMRSACLAIQAMPGQFIDINSLANSISILYNKLYEKIK